MARTVLLTGGSGVVGRAVLAAFHDHHVVCLTRRAIPDLPGEHVYGDLSRPGLGLDQETRWRLLDQVEVIIHCGAVTDFNAPASALDNVNVDGTRNVLAFASDAGSVVHYVSTAFVQREDLVGADESGRGGDPRAYVRSKRAAEKLVRDSGVPSTILRPSVIIGDSTDGVIAKFQALHSLCLAVLKKRLPLVPLSGESYVDFIPQDFLARVVAALVANDVSSGEYWVTAGEKAVRLAEMLEIGVEVAERLGFDVVMPRLVAPDFVDRLLKPVFLDSLPTTVRRRFEDMISMTPLFTNAAPFECTVGDIPGCEPISGEELRQAFTRSVEYLARVKHVTAGEGEVVA